MSLNNKKTSEWFFPEFTGGHIAAHLNAEYFKTDHIENIVSAFIRESIQNSLDATSGGTTKVVIRLGKKNINEFDRSLFDALSEHIRANESGIPEKEKNALRSNFNYIVFEDFNTTGLGGDVEYKSSILPTEENDFYYFFRNDGRSGKTTKKLGKWGIGKTVFPAISFLNMFWALTVRKSDDKKCLMGRSILGHHNLEKSGKEFLPYGYYGERKDSDDLVESNTVYPIDNLDQINSFEKLFLLERKKSHGLSIVVPFISDVFTEEELIYASISQFLYPILKGNLEIEVKKTAHQTAINKENIEQLIEDFGKKHEHYERMINQVQAMKKILELTPEDYITLQKTQLNRKPQWTDDLFQPEVLEECRDIFEQGGSLQFIVPVQLHNKKTDDKEWGKFKIYLERDNSLLSSEDVFIREGLRIPGVKSISGRNLRGIFIADEEPLTKFLAGAENPAHTEWQEEAGGFDQEYYNIKETLSFIINSFSRIINKLNRPLDEMDEDLLAGYFPFEISESSIKKSKKPKKKPGTKSKVPIIPVEKSFPPAIVTKSSDGFTVRKNQDYIKELETFEITVAYNLLGGNPFKAYEKSFTKDFNFDDGIIKIDSHGLNIIEKKDNKLLCEIQKDHFILGVHGFDTNRDLKVRVTKK